jgi:hypothetical protein
LGDLCGKSHQALMRLAEVLDHEARSPRRLAARFFVIFVLVFFVAFAVSWSQYSRWRCDSEWLEWIGKPVPARV